LIWPKRGFTGQLKIGGADRILHGKELLSFAAVATRWTPPSKIGDSFQPDCAGRTKPLDEVLGARIAI
jgi:hypothetical protein